MSDDSDRKAPRTEQYQAQQDGFDKKYYYKGNMRTFNEGETVPVWFKPVREILEDATRKKDLDRPTIQDAGIVKPKPVTVTPEQSSEGRMTAAEAGMPKVKPTPITTATGTETPTTEIEVAPEPKVEKKVKKKAKKKAVKRKTVKKKAK